MVGYALAVGARRPQNIYFSQTKGAGRPAHNLFLVSPRGLLECDEKVPFRFTRNIQSLVGRYGKLGPFFGSMVATLKALKSFEDILIMYLSVVIRDELAQWVTSKLETRSRGSTGSTGSGGTGKSNEFDVLEDRLRESIVCMLRRLCLPEGEEKSEQDEIGTTVLCLIERAEKPENLAQMDARWQAWYY